MTLVATVTGVNGLPVGRRAGDAVRDLGQASRLRRLLDPGPAATSSFRAVGRRNGSRDARPPLPPRTSRRRSRTRSRARSLRSTRPRPARATQRTRSRSSSAVPVRGERRLPRGRRHLLPRFPRASARHRQLPRRAGLMADVRLGDRGVRPPARCRRKDRRGRRRIRARSSCTSAIGSVRGSRRTSNSRARRASSAASSTSRLGSTIRATCSSRIHQSVGEYVSLRQGIAGQAVGQRVAEEKLGGFLESGIDVLPTEKQQVLFPAVDTSTATVGKLGVQALGCARADAHRPSRARRRTAHDRHWTGARTVGGVHGSPATGRREGRPDRVQRGAREQGRHRDAEREAERRRRLRELPDVPDERPEHRPRARSVHSAAGRMKTSEHWVGEHGKSALHALATYQVTNAVPGPANGLPRLVRLRLHRAVGRLEHRRRFDRGTPRRDLRSRSTSRCRRHRSRPDNPPVVTLDGPREVRRVAFTSDNFNGQHVQLFRLDQQQRAPQGDGVGRGRQRPGSGAASAASWTCASQSPSRRAVPQKSDLAAVTVRSAATGVRLGHRRPGRRRRRRILLADTGPDGGERETPARRSDRRCVTTSQARRTIRRRLPDS